IVRAPAKDAERKRGSAQPQDEERKHGSAQPQETPETLKSEMAQIDPKLTVFNIARQSDGLAAAMFLARVQTVCYGLIGMFGLLLAAVGLAGITAYAVSQRTKEIGVRVALGATRFQILHIVCREGALLIFGGVLIGEAASMSLT